MKKMNLMSRVLCLSLAVLMALSLLTACSGSSEVPDGFQYATCKGEYFRLFIPTQWTVNTESGVSGGFYSHTDEATVTMAEMAFVPDDTTEDGNELEAFYESHMAQISTLKNYKLDREPAKATLAGYRAKEIYYSVTVADKNCRLRQVLTKVAGRYYLFTYSAKADVFEQWLDIVDEILLNITFESFPYEGDHERDVPDNITPPKGMKLVSDNEVAYRFYAPESWIWESNVGQNLVYVSEEDKSNVSMIAYAPEDDTMTIEAYWLLCRDAYVSAFENFTLIGDAVSDETETLPETTPETTLETTLETMVDTTAETTPPQGEAITMGGQPARVYEYTYTLGGVTYHVRQVIVKHSAMIYTMTYTALPEKYEAHLHEAIAMQEALTFRGLFD